MSKPFILSDNQRIPFDFNHKESFNASAVKNEFFSNTNNPSYFQSLLLNEKNRLAFNNPPGPLNIYVCWWHSRLQRNSTYLQYYSPGKAKPTSAEARKIIKATISIWKVSEVPGFSNLFDFSRDYQDIYEEELGKWQISDSFFLFQWINGLKGKSKQNAKSFTKVLRKLYKYVAEDRKIAYMMQQIPGFDSHAILIPYIEKKEDIYHLAFIDSNFSEYTLRLTLKENEPSPILPFIGSLSIYQQYNNEVTKCLQKIKLFTKGR